MTVIGGRVIPVFTSNAARSLWSSPRVDATVRRIHQGNWAPGALRQTIETHIRRFDELDDSYLRECGADIRDLGTRLLVHRRATRSAAGSGGVWTGRQTGLCGR